MAISALIQAIQDVAWPEFLQPHVEVLLLWITWAVDYIDLDYLEGELLRPHGVCWYVVVKHNSQMVVFDAPDFY
nr:Hypothetical protein CBG01664 [Haemonchus contortus]